MSWHAENISDSKHFPTQTIMYDEVCKTFQIDRFKVSKLSLTNKNIFLDLGDSSEKYNERFGYFPNNNVHRIYSCYFCGDLA